MKGIDGASGFSQGHEAVSPFLVQEGEVGVLSLQVLETGQCLRNTLQTTLVGGNQVKGVALGGERRRKGLRGRQCLDVTLSFAELADPGDLKLGRGA